MPRAKLDFDAVRELALALPDVEDGTTYGAPALKLRGRLLACVPVNKSAEPDSVAVRIGIDERDRLLAEAPDTYYVTDHYVKHPVVLVRLANVRRGPLRELLQSAWRFVMERS